MSYSSNLVIFFALFLIPFSKINGQTCCTGAAPITGSMKINSTTAKTTNINIIFDYNKIADFYQENKKLKDDFIVRKTSTIFLQGSYGISKKLGVSILLPFVRQSETIKTLHNETVNNTNVGDITLFGQYELFKTKNTNIQAGLGVKLPTGSTKSKNQNTQFVLQPTLQIGTGSVDYIILAQANTSFPSRKSLSFQQLMLYKLNGNSTSYASHRNYKFGNEFQSFTTIADQLLIGKLVHTPSLLLRIRSSKKNTVEKFNDINSGGLWVYLSPGWAANITQTISTSVVLELPLIRDLNGFQITTSYKFIISLNVKILSKNENDKKFSL